MFCPSCSVPLHWRNSHLVLIPRTVSLLLLCFNLKDLMICLTEWFCFFELAARKPRAKCVVHQFQVWTHHYGVQFWPHTWLHFYTVIVSFCFSDLLSLFIYVIVLVFFLLYCSWEWFYRKCLLTQQYIQNTLSTKIKFNMVYEIWYFLKWNLNICVLYSGRILA